MEIIGGIILIVLFIMFISWVDGIGRYNTRPQRGQFKRSYQAARRSDTTGRSRCITEEVKTIVRMRDDNTCQHCGTRGSPGNPLEFDHIKPFSWGGSNEAWNIQILCHACNQLKGSAYIG